MEPTDIQLLDATHPGDRAAFGLLMRRYNRTVFRAARAVLRDDAGAEECAQIAWISAYEHRAQFRGGSFAAWVGRMAYRAALRQVPSRRKVEMDEIQDVVGPSPEAAAISADLRKLLERAIDQLPDSLREAFVMREVEGLAAAETAELLGISEENVRVRAHRARDALKQQLERDGVKAAFGFDGARCDRLVAGVMAALDPGSTTAP